MNKSVITSVSPRECELIASGRQTMLVRKTRPKIETPFTVYVYMTKHKWIFKLLPFLKNRFAKVIGSFVCDRVRLCIPFGLKGHLLSQEVYREMCLTKEQLDKYGGLKTLYGWHITEPKLFDKPRELGEFKAWRDCETPEKEYKNCTFGYRHPTHCEYCQRITRPPQSWVYCEPIEEE